MSAEATKAAAAVPPSLAPPPGNPRFPLTDSLRGIAALAVLCGHAAASSTFHDWWLARVIGDFNFAVVLFFVLSGFLIYRPFVSARARNKAMSLRRFARRRFLRIVPAYWAALTLLAIWPGVPDVHTSHWWMYYGLVHTYGIHTVMGGLGVTWTLCIELVFYLTLPLYAIAMGRWSRGALDARKELIALAVIAIVPSFFQLLTLKGVLPVWAGYNTMLGYASYFAIGMAFAVASVATRGREEEFAIPRLVARHGNLCWVLAFLTFAAIAAWFYVGPTKTVPGAWLHVHGSLPTVYLQNLGRFGLFGLAAALMVAPAVWGAAHGGLVRRFMAFRPLVAVGVISYSLSLWHVPLLNWMAPRLGRDGGHYLFGNIGLTLILATLAVSLPVAYLSYRLFELPFLKRKEPRAAAAPAPAPVPATAEA